jgi:NADH:ubiquinone oxidoreductase subunit 2 (subunit N)
MSFSIYILASTIYYSKIALEASIKYFILGGIASCIFVNGLS